MTMSPKILRFALLLVALGGALLATRAAAQPAPVTKAEERKYIPYRIARGDLLSIAVFGEPDLTTGRKKVENAGTIALALAGEIRVVGLTITDAQAAVEDAYRDGRFLRNPQVTITVDESVPRTVSISGKINIPGRHEMPTDTVWTLKDLVIKAGGLQETARGTRVRITRTMPDGTLRVFEKDVESTLRARSNANAAEASFVLEPDDIVYVPEKII